MPTATLTSKGQITIPKEVRDALGLRTGDQVSFQVADGKAVLEPRTLDGASLIGRLRRPRKPVTVEQMNEAIRSAGTRR